MNAGQAPNTRILFTAVGLVVWACGGSPEPEPLQPVLSSSQAEYTFRATGRGAVPDRLNGTAAGWARAERAARTNGYQKLAEQIYGVEIRSGTTVRDAVLEADEIRSSVDAFVRGARVERSVRDSTVGFVETEMVLYLGREFEEFLFAIGG